MRVIDGDSHFIEPLDLFERYVEPEFRERTVRFAADPKRDGRRVMFVDGRPVELGVDLEQLLAAVVGYGQKEAGENLGSFDRGLFRADARSTGQREDSKYQGEYLDEPRYPR